MKKLLAGGIGAAVLMAVSPVVAADMPVKAIPVPIVVPFSWTSCYIGVNGGLKWGRFRESVDTPAGTATILGLGTTPFAADHIDLDNLNSSSAAFGGQVGCRWETPEHWVFGFEGDFDWTNLHGTVTERTAGTGRSVFIPGDFFNNRARWESSGRVIVGRSFDRLLVYGTGGIAFTRVTMDATFIPTVVGQVPFPPSAGSDSKTLAGLTVGAGIAYAFDRNWDIGAEYRFTAYQKGDYALGNVAAVCGFTTAIAGPGPVCVNTFATGHKDLTTSEILVKLNYRFSWAAPAVVTKY